MRSQLDPYILVAILLMYLMIWAILVRQSRIIDILKRQGEINHKQEKINQKMAQKVVQDQEDP